MTALLSDGHAVSCLVPQDCMPWPILFNQFLVAFFLLSFLNLFPFSFLSPLPLSVFFPCLAQEYTKQFVIKWNVQIARSELTELKQMGGLRRWEVPFGPLRSAPSLCVKSLERKQEKCFKAPDIDGFQMFGRTFSGNASESPVCPRPQATAATCINIVWSLCLHKLWVK